MMTKALHCMKLRSNSYPVTALAPFRAVRRQAAAAAADGGRGIGEVWVVMGSDLARLWSSGPGE